MFLFSTNNWFIKKLFFLPHIIRYMIIVKNTGKNRFLIKVAILLKYFF